MRALVVFESMFGNTEKIARAIGDGLSARMPVDVVEVGSAPTEIPADVALLVVGGPTHAFGMSRPATRADATRQANGHVVSQKLGIREWLDGLSRSEGVPATAFDTKVKSRWAPGSAARVALKRLTRLGFARAEAAETFRVGGTPGPLLDGEVARAQQWGERLATRVGPEVGPQPV